MKTIKPFSQVKRGDIAYEHPTAGGNWNGEEGIIIWKGNIQELLKSKWNHLFSDWDMTIEEVADIDFVTVYTDS